MTIRICGDEGMKYKLGELCDVVSGGTPSRAITEFWEGGTIPWIKIGNIKGKYVGEVDEYITQAGLEGSSAKILSAGTILFTIFATLGEAGILTIRACTNHAIAGITIKNQSEALTDYPYYFLKSKKSHVTSLGRGVAQNNINLSILRNFEVPIPALSMQKQIVDVLDKAEKIIEARQRQLQKLDELVKARFIELFGTETEFDKWPCCTIGDVADVCVGVVIKPTQYYTDKGIPAFRSLNIGEMHVKDSDWVYFTEEGHQKNQKSVVHKNDVLVVRSGAPGTACVATEKYDGYNAVDIIIAHPDNSKVNSIFLAAFTNMPHGMNQIRERTGGAAQQHFNVGGYKAMRLIMPSIELQNQYAAFAEQTDKSKVAVQKALDEAQLLFDSLMQKYFG